MVLAVTFWYSGQQAYSILTLVLVLAPSAVVQVFSARWNKIDEVFSWPVAAAHALLLGTLHRYHVVLQLGLAARGSGDPLAFQRYYQQWSDICMLRLFNSFMESAPQLVFQLFILCSGAWSGWPAVAQLVSAVASCISLGWGVAAYSQALRLIREDKNELSMVGMALQTTWRFFMLAARITAMVLLALAIGKWAVIVFFVHWLLMSAWVLWQDTDFCTNPWEERLYNAVVGVIYCFCFFNLKEGRSRYRMAAFYTITFFENISFIGVYYFCTFYQPDTMEKQPLWLSLGAMAVVVVGTAVGLCSMVMYYRFHHPAGPILPCGKDSEDKLEQSRTSEGPDFVIKDATYVEDKDTSAPEKPPREVNRSNSLKHSRLVKSSVRRPPASPPKDLGHSLRMANRQLPSPRQEPAGAPPSTPGVRPPSEESAKASDRLDSAYGTDSNRTASRNTESSGHLALGKSPTGSYVPAALTTHSPPNPDLSGSSGSSVAFNNETYMSVETSMGAQEHAYMDLASPGGCQEPSPNNTYQSVHPASETGRSEANTSQESAASRVTVLNQPGLPGQPLKRSPVLKDVTAGSPAAPAAAVPPSPEGQRLHAPLTIIIPNISNQAFTKASSTSPDKWSEKTISLDILNPETGPPDISGFSSHDYENLALVNINRGPLGPMHWRTYSDMATSRHDDSTKYDKVKLNFTSSSNYSDYSNLASYCDIYPLSKAMKEQLYRSLTPVSTAATMATSLDRSESCDSNHTYEPIETAGQAFSSDGEYGRPHGQIPVTLIHHDGRRVTANTIINLDNLREALHQHEQIPYDDPEQRGDLYLLAPMRLLTPIGEETESDITTRSRTYQAMSTFSKEYSDVDQSIMSIISEVLNSRSSETMTRSVSQSVQQAVATTDTVDTNSLLSTIEEIRNNSMCNLYYSANGEKAAVKPSLVPRVPPRNTTGYESLCAENNKSKVSVRHEENDSLARKKSDADNTLTNEVTEHNDSIKSVESNTLVVTPGTVRAARTNTPLQTGRGCRKNILDLVPSTSDILNTPNRQKSETLSVPKNTDVLSDSLVTENEFKALMPHLSFSGAKFLSKVKKSPPMDDSVAEQEEVERPDPRLRLAPAPFPHSTPDISRLSGLSDTPSPAQFVRNIGNQARPKRKLSIVREKVERVQHDDDSDYKYGFMKQNPDAKYGFGYFPADSFGVVETAKLCTTSSYRNFPPGISSPEGQARLQPAAPAALAHYSLSALNKGDTAFKLHPDETYENLQRNNWGSASLQRRPSKCSVEESYLVRDAAARRSMSILDDFTEEKENILPPRAAAGWGAPRRPVKVLGNSRHQARACRSTS